MNTHEQALEKDAVLYKQPYVHQDRTLQNQQQRHLNQIERNDTTETERPLQPNTDQNTELPNPESSGREKKRLDDLVSAIFGYNNKQVKKLAKHHMGNESVLEIKIVCHWDATTYPFKNNERDRTGDRTEGTAKLRKDIWRIFPNIRYVELYKLKSISRDIDDLEDYTLTVWERQGKQGDQQRVFNRVGNFPEPKLSLEVSLFRSMLYDKEHGIRLSFKTHNLKKCQVIYIQEDNTIATRLPTESSPYDLSLIHILQLIKQIKNANNEAKNIWTNNELIETPISKYTSCLNMITYSRDDNPKHIFRDQNGDGKYRITDNTTQAFMDKYEYTNRLANIIVDKDCTSFRVDFWWKNNSWGSGVFWIPDKVEEARLETRYGDMKHFEINRLGEFLNSVNVMVISMACYVPPSLFEVKEPSNQEGQSRNHQSTTEVAMNTGENKLKQGHHTKKRKLMKGNSSKKLGENNLSNSKKIKALKSTPTTQSMSLKKKKIKFSTSKTDKNVEGTSTILKKLKNLGLKSEVNVVKKSKVATVKSATHIKDPPPQPERSATPKNVPKSKASTSRLVENAARREKQRFHADAPSPTILSINPHSENSSDAITAALQITELTTLQDSTDPLANPSCSTISTPQISPSNQQSSSSPPSSIPSASVSSGSTQSSKSPPGYRELESLKSAHQIRGVIGKGKNDVFALSLQDDSNNSPPTIRNLRSRSGTKFS